MPQSLDKPAGICYNGNSKTEQEGRPGRRPCACGCRIAMRIQEQLTGRGLPAFPGREEAVRLLCEREYGILPPFDWRTEVSAPTDVESRLCAGQASLSRVTLTVTTRAGRHAFPVWRLLHHDGRQHPFFVLLNFHPGAPSLYFPAEEIADAGFGVLSFCYRDVTSDDGNFGDGLCGLLPMGDRSAPHAPGKLAVWAWAASRVLDLAPELPCLDPARAAVLGHSRLGKAALLAGMLDERFAFVISNDSGCGGAALARGSLGAVGAVGAYGKTGESIRRITETFPYWFAPAYRRWAESNAPDGFDQHFLLGAIAPRHVYVASADMDDWADPDSEFLCCLAADAAWRAHGLPGLAHTGGLPQPGECLHGGCIGYHRRHGMHFLSRYDWNRFMEYIGRHTPQDAGK